MDETSPGRPPLPLLVPPLASAVLLWCAFPPTGWSWLAWVALVPFFAVMADDQPKSAAKRYGAMYLGGVAFWLLAISWVRLADETVLPGYLLMASLLAFGWPVALALGRLAVHRLGWPLVIAGPVAWVAVEFVRAHVLTGFAWYYLAHTQHAVLPLIQVADLGGALLLSLVMAWVNAAWVALARGPRTVGAAVRTLGPPALIVLLVLIYGGIRLQTASFRQGPRLALLQSSIEQTWNTNKLDYNEIMGIYADLVNNAMNDPAQRPDLVIWPETSYPGGLVEVHPGAKDLDGQARQLDPNTTFKDWEARRQLGLDTLKSWTNAIRRPMLVGTNTYHFRPEGPARYNSVVLIDEGQGRIQAYHKIHLVPFGEYVPLIRTFPFLLALTPYRGSHVPSLDAPDGPSWIDWSGLRLGSAVCFEDTVPQLVRRVVKDSPDKRPVDVLVNLSNDGWFRGSSEHDMHLAISVFRAVEHRVPLVRAVNTGVSAFVDGNGRVRSSAEKLKTTVLTDTVLLDDRTGLYTWIGDWPGWLAWILAAYWLVRSRFRVRRSDKIRTADSVDEITHEPSETAQLAPTASVG